MPGRSWRAGKAIAAMESPQALIAPLKRGSGELGQASSDAGRRTAKRWPPSSGAHEGLIAPLESGSGEFNKSSSDDRPGPGICDSKYVEDVKAARSVRVWDRVPI